MHKKIVRYLMALGLITTFASLGYAQESGAIEMSAAWHGNRQIVISRPGLYRLRDDLRARSGNAIMIRASNVTLDLGGNSVATESPGTGSGVLVASVVEVRNGKVGGFNVNLNAVNSENVRFRNLQVVGRGLAPNNGPTEIGVNLVQTRGAYVENNVITAVNLGIFVRGGFSTSNRIFENVITGGATPSSNLLGICYNPAPNAGTDGPCGDNIYNNHITRYGYAIAISAGSTHNVFNENVLASFIGGFREPEVLTTGGGTNVAEDNIMVTIPPTVLP